MSNNTEYSVNAELNSIGRIIFVATFILLGGCAGLPELRPVPGDYIVEQNITSVRDKLNKNLSHDYFVWYQGGTEKLSTQEQEKLMNWIKSEQPSMICLRGTGGAQEYKTLAENRAVGIISYLQEQKLGIDIVKLEYDPNLRGGRVLINQISPDLAEEIKSTAPMLIIKSD